MSGDAPAPEVLPLTDDALLGGRLQLLQPARGHRAGHDALLLAASVPATAHHVVDLGAGVGAAGLAVALRLPGARLHLIELDPATAELARRNAERQQPDVSARVSVVEADIAALARPGGPATPGPRAADAVLMNPPFNDPARHRISPSDRRALAHMAPDRALDDWVRAAERLLVPGGRLVLIHRPEALDTILATLSGRFGAVTIRPVHGRPEAPAIRVLVGAVKGRRTPPALLPGLLLADEEGRPTPQAEAVLRDGAGLA
ncbi:methyltransferase [Ancylobacter sp. Lp-2]|uniref:tRNA1(Val) (adenine(37)-N6)-methyltransferase n=1 Tax=Ancylobacter sp. Lp-2 TaxID=2881339 RepID=UPI001E600181|nr:methyltransferase [Ancylobacter sp. Lp-2]MCB4767470.1 methyltransferase [Ancylobacter sp. Lp-2]